MENKETAVVQAERAESKAVMALSPGTIPAGLQLYLNPDLMNQLYKVADMYAQSDIIPKDFKQKKGNCFIALEMAGNMGISPIFLMQNMAVVHGKPTLEAKLVSAMVNASGRFTNPLDYEVVGTDPGYDKAAKKPKDPTYKVRAFAERKRDARTIYGPWITWDMALAEGWVQKDGSKWQSMPELMFMYRAASYFAKVHCSDITYGMQTTEEMNDVIDITPQPANRAEQRRERAGNILNSFEDEAAPAEDPKEDPAPSIPPGDCDHPYNMLEDVEGVTCCRKCGSELAVEDGAPTYKEQIEIRKAELDEAAKQQQSEMPFK